MTEVLLRFNDAGKLVSVKSPTIEFVPAPPKQPAHSVPPAKPTGKRKTYRGRAKNQLRHCERVGCGRPFQQYSQNAPRQRFCPKCQAVRRRELSAQRQAKYRARGFPFG